MATRKCTTKIELILPILSAQVQIEMTDILNETHRPGLVDAASAISIEALKRKWCHCIVKESALLFDKARPKKEDSYEVPIFLTEDRYCFMPIKKIQTSASDKFL